MASYPKHINHELSPMKCPVALDDVDLFGQGAQEHWYEAYKILHREAPVLRIEGGGSSPGRMRSCSACRRDPRGEGSRAVPAALLGDSVSGAATAQRAASPRNLLRLTR